MANRIGTDAAARRERTILGIDPGLERTGYAVIEWPSARVYDAGLIRTKPGRPLAQRLHELEKGIEELFTEHAIGLLAVEELFAHYSHPRTSILMGHARGVILSSAARRDIEVVNLAATRVKRTLTGNGHAGKQQIQRAIMATFHLPRPPQPADVADALAIAWCAGFTETAKAPVKLARALA